MSIARVDPVPVSVPHAHRAVSSIVSRGGVSHQQKSCMSRGQRRGVPGGQGLSVEVDGAALREGSRRCRSDERFQPALPAEEQITASSSGGRASHSALQSAVNDE